MIFTLGQYSLHFSNPPSYPQSTGYEKVQASERDAIGNLHTESFHYQIDTKVLRFVDLPKQDYENLVNWYNNIADGSINTFQVNDEINPIYDAIILDQKLVFQNTSFEMFSGTLTLEVV